MATNTTNYNFKKPDESDFYSIQDQNGNWDKADAALKDVDTPTFEDYSGSMTVPDAATAINSIRSKGKLSTILSNMKAAFKGACLIGQIVNNCVTNNAKLPLSAAQGKALMDLYTQLNSDLAVAIGETSNITSASFTGKIIWQNLGRLTTLSFELTTKKELASGATYELISIAEGIPSKKANCVLTTSDGKPYYCYSSPDGKFYVANYTGAAIPANKVLYGQIAFISA